MGRLEDVEAQQAEILVAVNEADSKVEALYALVKDLTDNGITQAAADRLLAKGAEIKEALAKVSTDDEEPPVGPAPV